LRTTYYVASTLDGYIAEPDGGVDFLSLIGGEPDPESYEVFVGSVDALLMGRRTYDQILGFGAWPYGDRPCWVVSHRGIDPRPEPIVATPGTPRQVYDQIRQTGANHLWLVGGADLASQFLSAGLLDSLIVSVVPVVLGSGIALFAGLAGAISLEYRDAIPRANGIVELSYVPSPTR